mmetsp:Transcript_23892/g.35058  ORF Transcript_23892/g.35058 Transcript_23892/m.35058 type:complete len:725 (-) Transcript_23892:69-2243(-)
MSSHAIRELKRVFGSDDKLSTTVLCNLKLGGWTGNYITPAVRGLCWRVMLGVLSFNGISSWAAELDEQLVEYKELKKLALPDINKLADPLSGGSEGDWNQYYKDLEMVAFIKGDLERLYMNGVDDEYFKSERHHNMLLNVLFIWASRNPQTAYRQGMHEIVAPVLLVLEEECNAWSEVAECEGPEVGLKSCLGQDHMEASTYWMFERIMRDLEPLYSPVTGADEQPVVVHFCTKIQEHMLRGLDPELCGHLEDNYIQAQLYGMRWARLMLGREFELTEGSLLRIWDYMFACMLCAKMEAKEKEASSGTSRESRPSTVSMGKAHPLAEEDSDDDIVWTTTSAAMKAKSRFGPSSPLLEALGDFMLAMLLHIRNDLISGDSSSTMSLLMRYPSTADVTPIVDLADMIRRGVLDTGAHMGARLTSQEVFNAPSYDCETQEYGDASNVTSSTPNKRWSIGRMHTSPARDGPPSTAGTMFQGVGKRMTQTLSAVGSVMSGTVFPTDETTPRHQKKSSPVQDLLRASPVFPRRHTDDPSYPSAQDSLWSSSPSSRKDTPQSNDIMRDLISSEKGNPLIVSKKLNAIAGHLERLAAVDADTLIENLPDVVSRIRQLSGVLNGSITYTEYEERFDDLTSESTSTVAGLRRRSSDSDDDSNPPETPEATPSPIPRCDDDTSSYVLGEGQTSPVHVMYSKDHLPSDECTPSPPTKKVDHASLKRTVVKDVDFPL